MQVAGPLTTIGDLADSGQLVMVEESPVASVATGPVGQGVERPQRDVAYWRWLILISAVATLLRLRDLDGIGIWGDEVFEAREAVSLYRLDVVAALEGLIGHLTVLLALLATGADLQGLEPSDFDSFRDAGITPTSLRLAPAIIGSLTIPVIGALSRRFLGRRESLVLALLLAVAPWHLYWSQGGRFYAIQFLLYGIAFITYFEATERRSLRQLVVAMLFFVLAFNAQYTSFVLVAIIAGDWLIGRLAARPIRLDSRAYTVIGLAVACCLAMPLFLLLTVDSYSATHLDAPGNPPWHIAAAIVLFVHPVVVGTALVSASMERALPARKRVYLLLGAVVPIAVVAALSFRSFSGSRYGFVSLLPMLALTAVGVVHLYDLLAPKAGRLAAALPFLLVLGPLIVADVEYFGVNRGFRPQWATAADSVRAQYEPSEKVAVDLTHLGRYLLSDLGDGVVIGPDDIEEQDRGVWVLSTAVLSESLLETSVVEPGDLVQSFTTYYFLPRHRIDVWYIPSPTAPRAVPPAPDL